MRRLLLAGNWKMNTTLPEAVSLVDALAEKVKGVDDRDILVCPPAPLLAPVAEHCKGTNIAVGGQNVFFEDSGAFTAEWSCAMLESVGASYAIVGHSERRHIFGESDELIQKKVAKTLQSSLTPIMCVGETLKEREEKQTFAVLKRQVLAGLAGLESDAIARVVVAYEPVWAIGTGKTATTEQAQEAHKFIRKELEKCAGADAASKIRILYGGSVKPDNVKDLIAQPDIDGALVGGASLKADSFAAIVRGGAA